MVKSLTAMQESRILSLDWEDPQEKEMATHSNILAWKIPWTEELMGYSPWGLKESEATELARRTANSIVAPFLSFFLSSLLYSSFPPSFSLITGSSLYSLVFVVK